MSSENERIVQTFRQKLVVRLAARLERNADDLFEALGPDEDTDAICGLLTAVAELYKSATPFSECRSVVKQASADIGGSAS